MADISTANQDYETERNRREALAEENAALKDELFKLKGDTLNLAGLRKEILTWAGGIDHLSMGIFQSTQVKGKNTSTIPIFTVMVTWKDSTNPEVRAENQSKIKERVKAEIPVDSVMIISRN